MPFMCKTTVHFMEEYDLRGRNDKYSKTKTPQNALERALRENRGGHVFFCVIESIFMKEEGWGGLVKLLG